MSDNPWRDKSYKEGKYTVSVRGNLENDRVDVGDFSERTREVADLKMRNK